MTGTTTSTVLKNLQPDTEYTVTLVPVYHEMEGKPQSENGKTSESVPDRLKETNTFSLMWQMDVDPPAASQIRWVE